LTCMLYVFCILYVLCINCIKHKWQLIYSRCMSEAETMGEKKRTIGVTEDTYKELVKFGGYNESMDHIIRRCVEAYKREQARGKK
jgi:hypothetical protein